MAVCFSLPSLSGSYTTRDVAGRGRAGGSARAAAPKALLRLRSLRVSAAAEEATTREGSDPKTMSINMPAVLDINEIMNRLPHRFPFLLVRFWGSVFRLLFYTAALQRSTAWWSTCPENMPSASSVSRCASKLCGAVPSSAVLSSFCNGCAFLTASLSAG